MQYPLELYIIFVLEYLLHYTYIYRLFKDFGILLLFFIIVAAMLCLKTCKAIFCSMRKEVLLPVCVYDERNKFNNKIVATFLFRSNDLPFLNARMYYHFRFKRKWHRFCYLKWNTLHIFTVLNRVLSKLYCESFICRFIVNDF